jgi:hypothetical protein
MIPPAPTDFWDRVIACVAKMIWARETELRRTEGGILIAEPPPVKKEPAK